MKIEKKLISEIQNLVEGLVHGECYFEITKDKEGNVTDFRRVK